MRLQIDVFDNQKIVAVWLTKAERDDERVREKLRELRSEYKAKKYTVAEYQSGDGDLHTSIYELLRYNKLRVAERETERAKAAPEHDVRLQRKSAGKAIER